MRGGSIGNSTSSQCTCHGACLSRCDTVLHRWGATVEQIELDVDLYMFPPPPITAGAALALALNLLQVHSCVLYYVQATVSAFSTSVLDCLRLFPPDPFASRITQDLGS